MKHIIAQAILITFMIIIFIVIEILPLFTGFWFLTVWVDLAGLLVWAIVESSKTRFYNKKANKWVTQND